MPVDDDDTSLLHRSSIGDTAAFDTIVDRHEPSVHRFLTALGATDVEDVTQDAFIAAWKSAGSYQGIGTVRSWLLSIAHNVYRHSQRQRVGEPYVLESLDVLAEQSGWGRDPAEERRQEVVLARDTLNRAMARLPADAREVLVLRELEGFTGEETAELLQLTLPAVKSRLHRARLQLAAAVRQQDKPHSTIGENHDIA